MHVNTKSRNRLERCLQGATSQVRPNIENLVANKQRFFTGVAPALDIKLWALKIMILTFSLHLIVTFFIA
jgi:hypothetical protein